MNNIYILTIFVLSNFLISQKAFAIDTCLWTQTTDKILETLVYDEFKNSDLKEIYLATLTAWQKIYPDKSEPEFLDSWVVFLRGDLNINKFPGCEEQCIKLEDEDPDKPLWQCFARKQDIKNLFRVAISDLDTIHKTKAIEALLIYGVLTPSHSDSNTDSISDNLSYFTDEIEEGLANQDEFIAAVLQTFFKKFTNFPLPLSDTQIKLFNKTRDEWLKNSWVRLINASINHGFMLSGKIVVEVLLDHDEIFRDYRLSNVPLGNFIINTKILDYLISELDKLSHKIDELVRIAEVDNPDIAEKIPKCLDLNLAMLFRVSVHDFKEQWSNCEINEPEKFSEFAQANLVLYYLQLVLMKKYGAITINKILNWDPSKTRTNPAVAILKPLVSNYYDNKSKYSPFLFREILHNEEATSLVRIASKNGYMELLKILHGMVNYRWDLLKTTPVEIFTDLLNSKEKFSEQQESDLQDIFAYYFKREDDSFDVSNLIDQLMGNLEFFQILRQKGLYFLAKDIEEVLRLYGQGAADAFKDPKAYQAWRQDLVKQAKARIALFEDTKLVSLLLLIDPKNNDFK